MPAPLPPAEHQTRDQRLAGCLHAAASGSAHDFEAFYDATIGYARALARRILHGADIEDALADAYLDAWRMAARYDADRGSPVTWLLMIVHSRALDLWRRRGGPEVVADVEADSADDGGADPADRLWQLERGQRLAQALAHLSPRERWVLGLAFFRDESHASIAAATGLPLGTVKSLILRGQAKLRTRLADLP